MITPYVVSYCLAYGVYLEEGRYDFPGALDAVKRLRANYPPPAMIKVHHDDLFDIDFDGLTDAERDAVMEVL